MLVFAAALSAGCGSDSGRATMTVREKFEPIQTPRRVEGTTTRAGQPVRANCSLAAVYKVREATGTAFLIQSQLLHLRLHPAHGSRPARDWKFAKAGITYRFAPNEDNIHSELMVAGFASALSLWHLTTAVRTHASVRLAPARTLRPAAGKQIVGVRWPRHPGPAYDDYILELSFEVPKAPLIRERVAYTAWVSCGSTRYLEPVVPLDEGLGFVNAFTVPPNGRPFSFVLPHIATGISSHSEETQTLACAP